MVRGLEAEYFRLDEYRNKNDNSTKVLLDVGRLRIARDIDFGCFTIVVY